MQQQDAILEAGSCLQQTANPDKALALNFSTVKKYIFFL
jgi:hypothetical protein